MMPFLPETLVSIVIVALFCLTLAKNRIAPRTLAGLKALAAAAVFGCCVATFDQSATIFFGAYHVDLFSQGFKAVVALGLFFTCLLSREWDPVSAERSVESQIFLWTGALGMMLIASAVDILALFVSLELSAYSLYLLASLKPGPRNAESSVKYLIFGAAVSGISLWGLSLMTGFAGTTSIPAIMAALPALTAQPVFVLGAALFSFSLLFKLSAFPMHFWAPDVYESAPTPAVNYIATASKAAAVAVLIRLAMLSGMPPVLVSVIGVLAFASMTLGNTAALLQTDVKRLLAYSSVAQAGYILVGLLSGTREGYATAFFYAFAYVIMNSGAFLVTLLVARSINHDNPQVSDFDGLAERSPLLALILLLSLLSLAGIPPLLGFTAKWMLFTSAMMKGHWFLVLWAVLNSVVSLFYYLTLVKHAYLGKPKIKGDLRIPAALKVAALCIFAALVVIGVYPTYFIGLAEKAVLLALPAA